MESQLEKVLTVLMNKVITGIPNGKGGYLEQPIHSEARRFVAGCNGMLDAAVAAAAYEIFLRKGRWSQSVWRGALLVVVGQVPLVGSTAAVFYDQFETLWRQLRYVTLAAVIYGHDVNEDATQCQIILCLLDDKVRRTSGASAMDKIYSKSMKSGIQVAASVIARHVITKGGSSFLMKRFLGGLLAGVVPEAVGIIYTVSTNGANEEQLALRAKELNSRAKQHFKKDEQPSLILVVVAFVLYLLPLAIFHLPNVISMLDRVMVRLLLVGPFRAGLATTSIIVHGQEEVGAPPWFVKMFLFLVLAFLAFRVSVQMVKAHPWLVSTIALGVRAFLNFKSSYETAVCLYVAVSTLSSYHAHRALVGVYMIACRHHKPLKKFAPFVLSTLLVWILYNFAWFCWSCYFEASNFMSLTDDGSSRHDGLAWGRMRDAGGTLSAISLHALLEEVRRPDVVMLLVGPRNIVGSLLFAAKSLGHVVGRPKLVLNWLDNASPPFMISSCLLSVQNSATFLGFSVAILQRTETLSNRELLLACYGVLVTVPFLIFEQRLPPPHDDLVWSQALKSRHRVLYLLPELDDTSRSKLHFAIRFFEEYDFAVTKTQDYLSFVKVKEWLLTNLSRKEKEEFEQLNKREFEDGLDDVIEFELYSGMSYFQSIKYWLFGIVDNDGDLCLEDNREEDLVRKRTRSVEDRLISDEVVEEGVLEENAPLGSEQGKFVDSEEEKADVLIINEEQGGPSLYSSPLSSFLFRDNDENEEEQADMDKGEQSVNKKEGNEGEEVEEGILEDTLTGQNVYRNEEVENEHIEEEDQNIFENEDEDQAKVENNEAKEASKEDSVAWKKKAISFSKSKDERDDKPMDKKAQLEGQSSWLPQAWSLRGKETQAIESQAVTEAAGDSPVPGASPWYRKTWFSGENNAMVEKSEDTQPWYKRGWSFWGGNAQVPEKTVPEKGDCVSEDQVDKTSAPEVKNNQ